MTKIRIKNTNLELVRLNYYSLGYNRIENLDKKKLKYQVVYFTSPKKDDKELSTYRLAYGVSSFTLDTNVSSIYDEAWIIQKTKEPEEKDLSYDRYELSTLLGILNTMIAQHLDMAELLCHAIEDGPLLNLFYSSYGDFSQFKSRIKELDENPVTKFPDKKYALQYQRSKYSVYDLLYDLKKDGAEIYIGPDLITYKKISAGPKREYKDIYSWSKVSSVLGNKERANLSLVSYSEVSVNIPENEFGIEPGDRKLKEYRTCCIIKDGILWTRQIGVRISQKLHKKLVPTGCIIGDLLYKNDYFLDLSKIPVIGKKHLKVTRFNLAKLEVESELLNIAIQYKVIKDKIPARTFSDTEKFLHKLGIYDGTYCKVDKIIKYLKKSETVHSITTELDLIKDCKNQIKDFVRKGRCLNPRLEAYLGTLKADELNVTELKKKKAEVERKIRDYKFKLILSKYLKFTEHLSPRIPQNYSVDIPGDKKILVKWQNKLKKIELS